MKKIQYYMKYNTNDSRIYDNLHDLMDSYDSIVEIGEPYFLYSIEIPDFSNFIKPENLMEFIHSEISNKIKLSSVVDSDDDEVDVYEDMYVKIRYDEIENEYKKMCDTINKWLVEHVQINHSFLMNDDKCEVMKFRQEDIESYKKV